MKIEDLPLVLTVEEAAKALKIGRSAMYEAIAKGQVRSIKIGRKIRIPRAALAQLLGESVAVDESIDDEPC